MSDAPFIATLKWIKNDSFCSGAIIAEDAILTAAHCLEDKKLSDIVVRVGSDYRNGGGVLFRLKSMTIHPSYVAATRDFDLAVLILEKKLVLKPQVTEIVILPTQNEEFTENEVGIVSGFELPTEKKAVNNLRGVPVSLVHSCAPHFPNSTKNSFCAKNIEENPTSCFGYSGGEN